MPTYRRIIIISVLGVEEDESSMFYRYVGIYLRGHNPEDQHLHRGEHLTSHSNSAGFIRHLQRPRIVVVFQGVEGRSTSDLYTHCLPLCSELETLITDPQAREN